MAVMLRSIGIPSRVVTGFAGGYFNQLTGMYVIRASDAHAWVEAFLSIAPDAPEGTWTTFDPTPAASGPLDQASGVSRLSMYLEAADNAWHEWVVSYDLGHQALAAGQFETLLRRISRSVSVRSAWQSSLLRFFEEWGVSLIAAFCLLAVIFFFGPELWRDWHRTARVRRILRNGGTTSDAGMLYEQLLARLARRGLHKPAAATPIEFAAEAATRLPGAEGRLATQFTELYNAVRFGGDAAATARMAGILRQFDR
jgi:hypothetical protein